MRKIINVEVIGCDVCGKTSVGDSIKITTSSGTYPLPSQWISIYGSGFRYVKSPDCIKFSVPWTLNDQTLDFCCIEHFMQWLAAKTVNAKGAIEFLTDVINATSILTQKEGA